MFFCELMFQLGLGLFQSLEDRIGVKSWGSNDKLYSLRYPHLILSLLSGICLECSHVIMQIYKVKHRTQHKKML